MTPSQDDIVLSYPSFLRPVGDDVCPVPHWPLAFESSCYILCIPQYNQIEAGQADSMLTTISHCHGTIAPKWTSVDICSSAFLVIERAHPFRRISEESVAHTASLSTVPHWFIDC